MSTQQDIAVLIAHGNEAARDELVRILTTEGIQVVSTASDSETAVALARKLSPDVLFIDYDLPSRWSSTPAQGIETTEAIATVLPGAAVILLATEISPTLLRHAISAGARQFLQLPLNPDEVIRAVRQVYSTKARYTVTAPIEPSTASQLGWPRGQVIAVFSPRGGVGCTTIATNLAIAMRQESAKRIALVDGVLPFGDIGVFLDLAATRSLADLQGLGDSPETSIDADVVEALLVKHQRSGVDVLLAPQRPEMAEVVTGDMLRQAIRLLRERHEYVVVDTWSALDERVLTALEEADKVLLVLSLTLSAIRSSKVFLQVANLLRFPPDKTMVVATRIGAPGGLTNADLEDALGHSIDMFIPADEIGTLRAINEGSPLMLSARNTPVAQTIVDLARYIVATDYPDVIEARATQTGGQRPLLRIFGRG